MSALTSIHTMRKIAGKAMIHDASRRTFVTYEWDMASNCLDPQTVEHFGREEPNEGKRLVWNGTVPHAIRVIMTVPCRKCQSCLRYKKYLWTERAKREIECAERTWFGTITFNPEARYRFQTLTARRLLDAGVELFEEPFSRQFKEVCVETGIEVTKFLKRVRKRSGAQLRYLLVAEKHQSGDPHYHMLLHESTPEGFVRKQQLTDAWIQGFTQWKLVTSNEGIAPYLCKYLTKGSHARVRASVNYGEGAVRALSTAPPKSKGENQLP